MTTDDTTTKRTYGRIKQVPGRCIAPIWLAGGFQPFQCSRKPGHGRDGHYCKQHAKRYPAGPATTEAT